MPPVTRSKCKCSEDKTDAVRPRNPPLTIFSDEEIARLEEHEERAQQYRHERVLSGGYDRISSNDWFLSTDPEAKSTSNDISLASPPPSTPYRPVALRGCDVLGLWNHLRNNKGNEKGGALGRIVKSFADWDLYKLPLVLWLMGIMTHEYWEMINTDLVPQFACIGELEDEITALLQKERSRQALEPFDIGKASDFVLTLLSANIKMLCKRQVDHDRTWKALVTAQELYGQDRRFQWYHPGNDPRKSEEQEVNPEPYEVVKSREPNGDWLVDGMHDLPSKGTKVAAVPTSYVSKLASTVNSQWLYYRY